MNARCHAILQAILRETISILDSVLLGSRAHTGAKIIIIAQTKFAENITLRSVIPVRGCPSHAIHTFLTLMYSRIIHNSLRRNHRHNIPRSPNRTSPNRFRGEREPDCLDNNESEDNGVEECLHELEQRCTYGASVCRVIECVVNDTRSDGNAQAFGDYVDAN